MRQHRSSRSTALPNPASIPRRERSSLARFHGLTTANHTGALLPLMAWVVKYLPFQFTHAAPELCQ